MKVCNVDRNVLYQVLNAAFKARQVRPTIAELGVLRGENAQKMRSMLAPSRMVLIDSWSTEMCEAYSPFESLPAWVLPIESFAGYFGGPLRDQRTFDALYQECAARFANQDDVTIIRAGTIEAIDRIQPATGIATFDLIYVDANHQYEFVLRDLMRYQELVAPEGVLMLNDCCHSPAGTQQNLGVLEALTSFLKRTEFTPLALTNTDWSDVILARKGSAMAALIDQLLVNSDVPFVDVPPQLLPSARVVQGAQRANLSFC